MRVITEWIRTVLVFYFLMLIVLHLISGEQYKKFVRFFFGIVFVLLLMQPVMRVLGKEDKLMEHVISESFWQDMNATGIDAKLWENKKNEAYKRQYEQVLAERFLEEGKKEGFFISQVRVCLNEDYSMERLVIVEELSGDGEAFCDYLIRVYGIEKGRVIVQ
ncbi:MAG: stage III sporulation protein AF [bacterium]|nr:stage III sporulation protein AF [bacterium]